MKAPPANPVDQHRRFMAAVCADFATPEFLRTGKTPRADAFVAAARALKEQSS